TFSNDPVFFTHQHHARWLPNGHITMFDNGNFRLPLFSRAVEYAVDEAQKTATLVWQYRLTPDVFGPALGSVQRFANGNTLIGWGATRPALTEVAPDGSIVSELSFDPGVYSYRAFRFDWPPAEPALVAFQPATLILGGSTRPLRAIIQPQPSTFALEDIDLTTVRLNGVVRADVALTYRTDANGDGIPDLTVQFPRGPVEAILSIGTNRLEVTGSLRNGEIFRGSGRLKAVASSSLVKAVSVRVLSAAGALPVEIAAGSASPAARTLAIYDVQGRLVRRWRTEPGGRVTWDGRRADGRPVGAGIYFARSEEGGPGRAAKVVIIR
ncbi:MAG TPA: aryl-sulfate sulfotransferase, partial [Candidatus Saccharimonadales bacterium]|nr:aryl-sulfate sulfotransferase [Candidatus Saccharimonadales bacterium]